MAAVQNPPYQDPQGSQRWADWFRDIKFQVESVTTSISYVDDVSVAGAETGDFLVWTDEGLWENLTTAQTVETLGFDTDDAVVFDTLDVETLTAEDTECATGLYTSNLDVEGTLTGPTQITATEFDVGAAELSAYIITVADEDYAEIEHSHLATEITDLSIEDNSDVTVGTPSDEDVLTWNDGDEVWESQAAGGGGTWTLISGGTPAAESDEILLDMSGEYDIYKLIYWGLTLEAEAGSMLFIQVVDVGAETETTSGYRSYVWGQDSNGSARTTNQTGGMYLTSYPIDDDEPGGGANGTVYLADTEAGKGTRMWGTTGWRMLDLDRTVNATVMAYLNTDEDNDDTEGNLSASGSTFAATGGYAFYGANNS